jgi:5-formyltetrahydrofolate cyclo-ligase
MSADDSLRAEKQAARKLIKSRLKDMGEEQMAAESVLFWLAACGALKGEERSKEARLANALAALPSTTTNKKGALIAAHVVAFDAFRAARAAGVYVHCARLREVDTTAVLEAALAQGACACLMQHWLCVCVALRCVCVRALSAHCRALRTASPPPPP